MRPLNLAGVRRPAFRVLGPTECQFDYPSPDEESMLYDQGGHVMFTNPATGMMVRRPISAEKDDWKDCAQRGIGTFVVYQPTGGKNDFPVGGMNAFIRGQPFCSVYLDNTEDMDYVLGEKGLDQPVKALVKRLSSVCSGNPWVASAWPEPLAKPKRTQVAIEGLGGRCAR